MDNIVSKVARVYLTTAISKKTQREYTQLHVEFIMPKNQTYTFTTFLNDEQKALITLASQVPSTDSLNTSNED